LLDQSGKLVVLRARVAISPHVTQPILCYGRLLEAGWGINPTEQTLTHAAGACVPIEFNNMSVTVKGWIRVISSGNDAGEKPPTQLSVCAALYVQVQQLICVWDLLDGSWQVKILELADTTQTIFRTLLFSGLTCRASVFEQRC
jgi:hypothetical protein